MRRLRLAAFSRTSFLLVAGLVLSGDSKAFSADQSSAVRLVFLTGFVSGSPDPRPAPLPSALVPPPELDGGWASDPELLREQVVRSLGLQGAIIGSIRAVVPQPGRSERVGSRAMPFVVELRSEAEGRWSVRCLRGTGTSGGSGFISLSLEPGATGVLAAEASGPTRSVLALTRLTPGSEALEIHTVGGGVTPPRLIDKTEPHYPEMARKQKRSGVVLLEVIVEHDGRVGSVWVARPADPDLDAAAAEAVRQWRYEPAVKDGKPVRVFLTVTVSFNLH